MPRHPRKPWKLDRIGNVTVEYALLLSGVAMGGISAWHGLGNDIGEIVSAVSQFLQLR